MSKPCFLKILAASLRTSPSMPGRIWSRNSTTVTFAPSRRQTEPSSRPMTPPPITTMWPGTLASSSAPVESTIRSWSISTPGQRRDRRAGGDDDVLRGVGLAARRRSRSAPVNFAWPLSQVTLFFLNRNSMPPVSPLTASLRPACIASRSSSTSVALIPHLASVPCAASSNSSEAWSRALDGMQPTLRQVPPSVSRLSTQAVLSPSCAARMAAT